MGPVIENLLYEMVVVEEPSVHVEVRSARGTMSWQHPVTVERLIHYEPLPDGVYSGNEANRIAYRERLNRLARGAATEQFVALTAKTALNAGLDWLMLNLEPADHVFLFSTRVQEQLGETLGSESGTLEFGQHAFFIITDRRVPENGCFCVRTRNYKVFARHDLDGAYARVYMSEFVKTGAGRNAVRLDAHEAIRYLHALRHGARPTGRTGVGLVKLPPIVGRPTHELGDLLPDGVSHAGRPAFPADITRVVPARPSKPVERLGEAPVVNPGSLPEACPSCGGELFRLSATDVFCRSCDWSNLPPLARSRDGE
jgi:hypothetical protein